MTIPIETNFPKTGIHRHVSRYIASLPDLSGKRVLDIPAGDGRASYEFLKKGATVLPYDLFPNTFTLKETDAKYADMLSPLPLDNESVDYIVCQEGIEHVPDPLGLLSEFNRVLKKDGQILLSTPNQSHLRARLSWFLFETDYWKRMPPTEVDSVWFTDKDSERIYYGHLFLLGVHYLGAISRIRGFELEQHIRTDFSATSILLSLFFWPVLLVSNTLTLFSYGRRNKQVSKTIRNNIFRQHYALNLSYKTLLCKHTLVVLKKRLSLEEATARLKTLTRTG